MDWTAWTITCLDDGPTITGDDDQTVDAFEQVSLSVLATEPNDPDPVASYAWTAPADIILIDGDTATPSFTAPFVAPGDPPRIIPLEVTATDDDGDEITTTVNVTVNPSEFDFSDAPAIYEDAFHTVVSGVMLGTLNDIDPVSYTHLTLPTKA